MPWDLPEDLAFFQRETLGGAIIMGRRTWDSLHYKPLKNRMNLVVTSKECERRTEVHFTRGGSRCCSCCWVSADLWHRRQPDLQVDVAGC